MITISHKTKLKFREGEWTAEKGVEARREREREGEREKGKGKGRRESRVNQGREKGINTYLKPPRNAQSTDRVVNIDKTAAVFHDRGPAPGFQSHPLLLLPKVASRAK